MQKLCKSIVPISENILWNIQITSVGIDGQIDFAWDITQIPENYDVYLLNEGEQALDMRTKEHVSFQGISGTVYK